MKIKRVIVKKSERGLLLRNGDFERVLQPGTHWLFDGIDHLRVETFALEQPAFAHGLASYLMAKEPGVVAAEFVRVELTETQVGLRSENGALVEVLAPATRRLYWKGQVNVGVEVIDIAQSAEVPSAVVARLVQNADASTCGGRPGRRAAGAGA
jgi:regulator of protease activity HflC (stomatin/prohibitin superfamily)